MPFYRRHYHPQQLWFITTSTYLGLHNTVTRCAVASVPSPAFLGNAVQAAVCSIQIDFLR